jgi:hypothetical protein
MKVKDHISELLEYNLEAEISVVVHCREEQFTLAYGGSEDETKKDCESVSLYVDRLCTNENTNQDIINNK